MAQRTNANNVPISYDWKGDEVVENGLEGKIVLDITELYSLTESIPTPSSDVTVNSLTLTTQPTTDTSTASTVNTLVVDSNGIIKKKAKSNTKVYRALLTQNGTNNPVANVLENTFGSNPSWERVQAGSYTAIFPVSLDTNKTIINNGSSFLGNTTSVGVLSDLGGTFYYTYFDFYDTEVYLRIYPSTFVGLTEMSTALGTTPLYVEIISYP